MYELDPICIEAFSFVFNNCDKLIISSKELRQIKKDNNIKQFNHQLLFGYDDFVICNINKIKG